jgi:hypothetical protein
MKAHSLKEVIRRLDTRNKLLELDGALIKTHIDPAGQDHIGPNGHIQFRISVLVAPFVEKNDDMLNLQRSLIRDHQFKI